MFIVMASSSKPSPSTDPIVPLIPTNPANHQPIQLTNGTPDIQSKKRLQKDDPDQQLRKKFQKVIKAEASARSSSTTATPNSKRKSRARNFTEEETSIIMKESALHLRLLKGRFGPGVTNEIKEERWIQIAAMVNSINGANDRTWENVRKKFQDVESSARTKSRKITHGRKQTGGGKNTAPPLTKVEQIAMENIPSSVIQGFSCGIDSNTSKATASTSSVNAKPSGSSLSPLTKLLRETNALLAEDTDKNSESDIDSEISFNTIRSPGASIPRSLDLGSLDPLELRSPQASTGGTNQTTDMQTAEPTTPEAAQTPPVLPPITSNRTVTRDLRKDEFKELLKRHDTTNLMLKQLVELLKAGFQQKYPNVDVPI